MAESVSSPRGVKVRVRDAFTDAFATERATRLDSKGNKQIQDNTSDQPTYALLISLAIHDAPTGLCSFSPFSEVLDTNSLVADFGTESDILAQYCTLRFTFVTSRLS